MKKIIAAALSILVGAFGYTIVDSAIEDRVATLESEVVELREEVSRYHPNYSSQTTTRRATTSNFTTIKNDTSTIVITEKPTTTWVDLSAPFQIGSFLKENSRSMHKFVLRKWEDGNIQYVSPDNFANSPTAHIFTMSPSSVSEDILTTRRFESNDYYLYIAESSAQVTDISENISYSYSYDKDYSKVTNTYSKTQTTIKVTCKGYTDPIFAGKNVVFRIQGIGTNHYISNNTIRPDGSFEYNAEYIHNGYISAYNSYYFNSVSIENISFHTTTQQPTTTQTNY